MSSTTERAGIAIFRLRAAIKAIQLEQAGMKRRGKSVTQMYREHYKLPRSAKREAIIAMIEKDIEHVVAKMLAVAGEGGKQ